MRTENQEILYISCLDSALQKGLKRHALEVFDVKKRQSTFLHTSSWPLGEKKNKKKPQTQELLGNFTRKRALQNSGSVQRLSGASHRENIPGRGQETNIIII